MRLLEKLSTYMHSTGRRGCEDVNYTISLNRVGSGIHGGAKLTES